MEQRSTDRANGSGGAAVIELRGVCRVFGQGKASRVEALKGIDLTVERAEFIAVTGPSGSGKSTLLHVLGCLDRPSAGTYRLLGRETSRLSDRRLSALRNRQIGFVFQAFNLLPGESALENVMLPLLYRGVRPSAAREEAMAALESVGLADRIGHRPGELSGGEQQRVAVARALVKKPEILLADEPTGNLDSVNGRAVMDLIDAAHASGVTVVVITHEPSLAERARRVVTLHDGRISGVEP